VRDDQRVFYFTDQIAEADDASFRVLDGPYALDSRRVYWMGKAIIGADPATFRVLNADFECSADQDYAYYQASAIVDAGSEVVPAWPQRHRLLGDVDFLRGIDEKEFRARA
jgi:hypothetical protein